MSDDIEQKDSVTLKEHVIFGVGMLWLGSFFISAIILFYGEFYNVPSYVDYFSATLLFSIFCFFVCVVLANTGE